MVIRQSLTRQLRMFGQTICIYANCGSDTQYRSVCSQAIDFSRWWLTNADVDWLHCIAAHRKKKLFVDVEREMAKYDIIAGKIADDATNATLTAYLAGAFGTAGDQEADDFCIKRLLPNKLKDQYCFKTEAAIECLKFVRGEKIWLK